MENQSFVDRSDFLALRSVDEAEEGKEAEVGGISNIPMFSSSEEKLLEYNSLQVKKSVLPTIYTYFNGCHIEHFCTMWKFYDFSIILIFP